MRATTAIATAEVARRTGQHCNSNRRGSRWRRHSLGGWIVGLALCANVVPGAHAATAHVQYLSSSSVYLDAGRASGIETGATVRVERDGKVVAELLVEFVAQSSAACKIVSSVSPIRIGDTCTFTSAAGTTPGGGGASKDAARGSGSTPTGRSQSSATGWLRPQALHGSVAFAYRRSGEEDGSFSNPAFRADVRWDGSNRRQLAMRLRADRPIFDFQTSSEALSEAEALRFYEVELRYRSTAERFEVSAGRFIPTRLEPMGYLDGAAGSVQPVSGLRMGAVGGSGARLATAGFETQGWKLGGYVEASDPRRGAPTRWRLLVAAARLEDAELTRRQFVLVRGDERLSARLRAWEHVEIDVNPGWKQQLGEKRVEVTAASIGGQATLHRNVDVTLGFDSRRDLLSPEQRTIAVDNLNLDRTHGVHGAVHLRLSSWTAIRLGADWRALEDGTRSTRSWDGSVYGSHPSLPSLSGILHANVYDASPGRGELLDASLSMRATQFLRIEIAGGTHLRRDLLGTPSEIDPRTSWFRLGGGLDPMRGLWLDASAEWRTAPSGSELHLGIGQRF